MTSVYSYGQDSFHRSTASLGHNQPANNYYSNNNFRQAQPQPQQPRYNQNYSAYSNQPFYNQASVYSNPMPVSAAPVSVPAYNPVYNTGYYASGPVQAPQQTQNDSAAASGGLLPVLDYDIKIMSKFMTYLSFRISGRSDTSNEQFITNIQNILSAVRLPLSSLILANYFLLKKYEKDSHSFQNTNQEFIKEILILCLVLANKANDDNNFTNKSWQDATGLDKSVINRLEVQWLTLFEWRLHDVNMQTYNELLTQFNKYSKNINAHEEQKKWELQVQSQNAYYYHQQQVDSMSTPQTSPLEGYSARFNNSANSNYNNNSGMSNWSQGQRQSEYSTEFFKPSRYSHFKTNSLHSVPDFCARTGSYEKMKHCTCNYCSNATNRPVDWSYKIAAAY